MLRQACERDSAFQGDKQKHSFFLQKRCPIQISLFIVRQMVVLWLQFCRLLCQRARQLESIVHKIKKNAWSRDETRSFKSPFMVYLRLNEKEPNPNPFINLITALPMSEARDTERARQLLRALAAQVRPVMKAHGFTVNSFEEV